MTKSKKKTNGGDVLCSNCAMIAELLENKIAELRSMELRAEEAERYNKMSDDKIKELKSKLFEKLPTEKEFIEKDNEIDRLRKLVSSTRLLADDIKEQHEILLDDYETDRFSNINKENELRKSMLTTIKFMVG